jgi:hypothetical protein
MLLKLSDVELQSLANMVKHERERRARRSNKLPSSPQEGDKGKRICQPI